LIDHDKDIGNKSTEKQDTRVVIKPYRGKSSNRSNVPYTN